MACFKSVCCCFYKKQEFNLNEDTRLQPGGKNIQEKINKDKPNQILGWGVVPERLELPKELLDVSIDQVVCGTSHTIFTANRGALVFSFGLNNFGQCGVKGKQDNDALLSVKRIQFGEKISEMYQAVSVACGSYFTLIVCNDKSQGKNKMFTFGHELGTGTGAKEHQFMPTELKTPDEPLRVYAGFSRASLLTQNNQLYIWGEMPDGSRVRKPQIVNLQQIQVDKVSFGRRHCVILNTEGKVYSWGDSTYGETGLGTTQFIKSPTPIEEDLIFREKRVVDIACGARHTLCLTSDGDIYSFGDNSDGQCGLDVSRNSKPTILFEHTEDIQIQFIFSGETHCAMITDAGETYMWGDATAGRLGFFQSNNVMVPTLVQKLLGKSVVNMALGGQQTIVFVGKYRNSLIYKSVQETFSFGGMKKGLGSSVMTPGIFLGKEKQKKEEVPSLNLEELKVKPN